MPLFVRKLKIFVIALHKITYLCQYLQLNSRKFLGQSASFACLNRNRYKNKYKLASMESNKPVSHGQLLYTNYSYQTNQFFYDFREKWLKMATTDNLYDAVSVMEYLILAYSYQIKYDFLRNKVSAMANRLKLDIDRDKTFHEAYRYRERSVEHAVSYVRIYYRYYIRACRILVRLFRNNNFMPLLSTEVRQIRYIFVDEFFRQHSELKSNILELVSKFSIADFRNAVNGILVFYYAFQMYVPADYERLIDKMIEDMISSTTDGKILALLAGGRWLSQDEEALYEASNNVRAQLREIMFYINKAHQVYDLNPRLLNFAAVDNTAI